MNDWTHGYVTDIEYTSHYYPELAPTNLQLCGLSKNVVCPSPEQSYTWLEIGCGNGLSANALAACNSHAQFYAFDFNPVHIVNAKKMAADVGLSNVHFFDDSFEQALERDLPPMDFIVLHGIYSWVSKENQTHILRIIQKFLKLGGVVYVSYNCLPGWSNKAPLRHLMTQYAGRVGGNVKSKVDAIKIFLDGLKDAQFQFMTSNPSAITMTDKLKNHTPNYIAHEYLNADWNLFYSNEIAQDMKSAKLNFAASATMLENADEANYDQKMLEKIRQEPDSDMRELLKDFAKNRQFRRDIFVKGLRSYDTNEIIQLKESVSYALYTPRQACNLHVELSIGKIDLSEEVYKPILDALAQSPQSIEQLLIITKHPLALIVNAMSILIGLGYAIYFSTNVTKATEQACKKFNKVVLERNLLGKTVNVLASPHLKAAFPMAEIDQYFLYFYKEKKSDLSLAVYEVMKKLNKTLVKEGAQLESEVVWMKELGAREAAFHQDILPQIKMFGIA